MFLLYNSQLSPQLLSSYGLANNGHYGQDLETVELDRLSFVIQQAVDILLEKSQNNFEHLHTVEIIINSLLEYFQRLRSSIPLGSVIQSPKLSVEIVLLYGLSKLYIREEPHISIGLKMLLPLLAQLRADDKILLERSVDLDSNRDCFSAAGPDLSKLDDVDHNFRELDGTIMDIDDTSAVQQGIEKDGNLGATSSGDSTRVDPGPVSAVSTSSTYGSTSSAIPGLPYGAVDYGDIDDSELIPLDLQPLAYDGEGHGQGHGHGEDVDAGEEKGERKGEGEGKGDEEKEGVDEIELIPLAFDNQNEGEHIDPYSGDTDALFPPSEEDMKREQKEVEGLERSAQDSQTFLLRQRLRIAEELTRIGMLCYVMLCCAMVWYVIICSLYLLVCVLGTRFLICVFLCCCMLVCMYVCVCVCV